MLSRTGVGTCYAHMAECYSKFLQGEVMLRSS